MISDIGAVQAQAQNIADNNLRDLHRGEALLAAGYGLSLIGEALDARQQHPANQQPVQPAQADAPRRPLLAAPVVRLLLVLAVVLDMVVLANSHAGHVTTLGLLTWPLLIVAFLSFFVRRH